MAAGTTISGKLGAAYISTDLIGGINNFSLTERAAELQANALDGTDTENLVAGLSGADITFTGFYQSTDTGQNGIRKGATPTLILYPGGNAVGQERITGDFVIFTSTTTVTKEGLVTYSATGKATSVITRTIVT